MMSQKTAVQQAPTASEKKKIQMQVRWMIRRDMNEVFNIEQTSFDFAWTEEDLLSCLRQRNCIGMVVEHLNHIVGFMFYELHKNRLHVLNFAVHPDFRRCGVGNAMVEKLVNKLSQQRRQEITLEVRETNLAAQLFFKQQGFRSMGVLCQHYADSNEDAYSMCYRLDGNYAHDTHVSTNRISKFQDGRRASPY